MEIAIPRRSALTARIKKEKCGRRAEGTLGAGRVSGLQSEEESLHKSGLT